MRRLFEKFWLDESGQDIMEYALLCGFITLFVISAATAMGDTTNDIYAGVAGGVNSIPLP